MRNGLLDKRRGHGWLRFVAVAGLSLAAITPLAGCELEIRSDNDPSLGDALSDVGQATENTWGDFEDWWDERF